MKIYCDGGARGNPGPAASAFVVFDENKKVVCQEAKFLGQATNNVAEYQAVIMALGWLLKNKDKISFQRIYFYLDSKLVVKQLKGEFRIKNRKLQLLVLKIKELERGLDLVVNYKHIPREENKKADLLVNTTLDFSVT